MIGVIIAAHGELASSLLKTARSVVTGPAQVEAVAIDPGDDTASYGTRLEAAIARVRGDGGVLLLTDMFGGTPANVGLALHKPGGIEVLTGVNLPMVIKAFQLADRGLDLENTAAQARAVGLQAIRVASELLQAKGSGTGG